MNRLAPSGPGNLPRSDVDTARRDRRGALPDAARRGAAPMAGDQRAPFAALSRRLDDLPRQQAMPRGSYVDILA